MTTCLGHALAQTPAEARTQRAFTAARQAGPAELYAFLRTFPKGGDLHLHLSGAVYAETFLAEAAANGMCVDTQALKLAPKPADSGKCKAPLISADAAINDQELYDRLIDALSMRGFVPTPGVTGHDQFFSTFARFNGLKGEGGDWLREVATRAAAQNEQYLEIMQTPAFSHAASLGYKQGWPAGITDANHMEAFAKLREQLLAVGLRDEVATDREEFAAAERDAAQREGCNASQGEQLAVVPRHANVCHLQVRWLYQVLRAFPPQQVFAQTLLGFETVAAEMAGGHPHVVGINFVQPEDARLAMADYHLQMLMLDYLHSVYPQVHISLHAGELAPGLVPPEGLGFHIREAVLLGHAERIGHGVDVLYENDPMGLLNLLAKRHVDIEINLTSNAVILGVQSNFSPLEAYRAHHVPYSLSTDDEGVSRIDLTHEYVRAVLEQGLGYADLQYSARDSLEYSFLPGGESLAAHRRGAAGVYASRGGLCRGDRRDTGTERGVRALPGRQRARAAAVDAGTAVRRIRGLSLDMANSRLHCSRPRRSHLSGVQAR